MMFTIKLDFDSRKYPNVGTALFRLRSLNFHPVWLLLSRSQHNGWHAIIQLRGNISDIGIISLQLLCGSDPKRETFNLARVLQLKKASLYWQKRWNILYASEHAKRNRYYT